ncbi:DUF29 domain-containing protein [Thermosynechococcaceae cyanobacterium BACA0444]|uniref:DUF29 domain-containing protein n=2 Tax=Pseudocalidococcus TaxID=3110321 RepID=A0AAE4JXM8_9CYAN|nr:DUF29 domain-containing protein [Pseudocalidococcus azoricus BACA0444]
MESSLYETDFYAWTVQQSKLLQERCLEQLDFINLIEEIESLGKQQRQELRNRLTILIGHLLKWDYQLEKRSKSWFITIRNQRREIYILLKDNSSLQPFIPEALKLSFLAGLDLAVAETSLRDRDLPSESPYTVAELLDPTFPPSLTKADF